MCDNKKLKKKKKSVEFSVVFWKLILCLKGRKKKTKNIRGRIRIKKWGK